MESTLRVVHDQHRVTEEVSGATPYALMTNLHFPMMSSNAVGCVVTLFLLDCCCCCLNFDIQNRELRIWRVMELPVNRLRKARGFKVNLSAPLNSINTRLFPQLPPSHQLCSPLVKCSPVPRGVPSPPPQDSCVLTDKARNTKVFVC